MKQPGGDEEQKTLTAETVAIDVVNADKKEGVSEIFKTPEILSDKPAAQFKETVVAINRVTKVVSGGKRLAFTSIVVVGDGQGHVGIGKGKARDVQSAIAKATFQAKKHLLSVPLINFTIPYAIVGEYGAARVLLRPAAPGTGVIAGGSVRAVLEAVGVKDILTKNLGNSNVHNVLKATLTALGNLRTKEDIAKRRGKKPEAI
ncbi:MAG: 30S ribosomal protein S5 [Elusimicrobia bacterium]|nr:30S ribosomal protein S5 [Elusimicrobiota bacterium]